MKSAKFRYYFLYVFLFLSAVLLRTTPCQAEYTMKDLQALVGSSDFEEAYYHLKDLPPTSRTEEWKQIAKKTVIGRAKQYEKDGCYNAWEFYKEAVTSFAFLDDDKDVKAERVRIGVCTVKTQRSQFYEFSDLNAFVDEIVKIDPVAIYPLVMDADFDDYRGLLISQVAKNPEKYKADKNVHNYLLNMAKNNAVSNDPQKKAELDKLMKDYGLQGTYTNSYVETLKKVANEVIQNDYSNDMDGFKALDKLQATGNIPTANAARFLLPELVVSTARHTRVIPFLQKLPTADIQKAEAEMLKNERNNQYDWFTGGDWDKKANFEIVKKYAPTLVQKALAKCAAYQKDSSKDPYPVGNCDDLEVAAKK